MTSGKGLGKGLSALFGEDMTEDIAQVRGIKLRDIEPNPDQPRREFDPEALSELEESIRQNGVITPITVRRTGDNYVIIAGERRWRAARAAGLDEIPAYVLDVSEKEAYQFALVENLQRQDLNPIEEAMGYRKLIDDFGYSQDKAGEKVGRSRSYITNSLRRRSLPQTVIDMISAGVLSAGHGRALVVLSEQQALEAAKTIIEKELSVRETEKLVKRMTENDGREGEDDPREDLTAMYLRELERQMASSTGHKVTIVHGKRKGKLTIEYYGNEDLEKVCAALNKIEKE